MRGLLGKATDDFCEDGRLVEKTTYGKSPRESRGGAVGVGAPAPSLASFMLHPDMGREGPSQTLADTPSQGWLLGAWTRDSVF